MAANLMSRTYLQGVHDGMVEKGAMVPLPDEATTVAVFDKIAEAHGFPPILERDLNRDEALAVMGSMKEASDYFVKAGKGPSPHRQEQAKLASQYHPSERAQVVAAHYMEKAAAEGDTGSLTSVGTNTPAEAAQVDPVAKLDLHNRAPNAYGVPTGTTDLPQPGVIGRELPAPGAEGVKVAEGEGATGLLARMRAAMGSAGSAMGRGASAVGGALDPRKDLGTLANSYGVSRGVSSTTGEPAGHLRALYEALSGHPGAAAATAGRAAGAAGALGGLGYGAAKGIQALRGDGNEGATPDSTPSGDLTGGDGDQGALHRAAMFLSGLKNKIPGFRPSPEAALASAGLGSAGNDGLEVMAHVIETVKTAEEAEDELTTVLHVLSQNGVEPSPELVQALGAALAEEGGAGAPMAQPSGMPPKQAAEGEKAVSGLRKILEGEHAKKLIAGGKAVLTHPVTTHGAAAVGGAAAAVGGKKLYDHLKDKKEEQKAASYWDVIKRAAVVDTGSLTSVGNNTPAEAAQVDPVAKLDAKNRPDGAYKIKPGTTSVSTAEGEIGKEKAAQEKAAQDAYVQNLTATAQQWGGHLPATMPIEEKHAQIAKLASMAPSDREAYVLSLRS